MGSSPFCHDVCRPLFYRPFVPLTLILNSWEHYPFNKVPDCPQTWTSNYFRVQGKRNADKHECRQSFSLTQNMNGGFLLCFTPPTQGTVYHPHFVEIFSQVVSSKKVINYPGLHLIKESNLILAARLNPRSFLGSVSTVTCKLCICLYDPLQPYILIKNTFYKFVKHKCLIM